MKLYAVVRKKKYEKPKQLVYTADFNAILLMFCTKLASWNIHIEISLGRPYNMHNQE